MSTTQECRAHSCPSQKVLCARRGKECLKYRKSEPPVLIAGLPRKAGDVTEKRSQGLYTVAERIRAQCGVVFSFLLFPFFDSFLLSLFPFEQLQGISHWEAMTPSYSVAYTDVFFILFFLVNSVFPTPSYNIAYTDVFFFFFGQFCISFLFYIMKVS